jgi:hypothetical protein
MTTHDLVVAACIEPYRAPESEKQSTLKTDHTDRTAIREQIAGIQRDITALKAARPTGADALIAALRKGMDDPSEESFAELGESLVVAVKAALSGQTN